MNALQQMYLFKTMELAEYFVKTKATARLYMAQPAILDNTSFYGFNELSGHKYDHLTSSTHQEQHLFTIKVQFKGNLDGTPIKLWGSRDRMQGKAAVSLVKNRGDGASSASK